MLVHKILGFTAVVAFTGSPASGDGLWLAPRSAHTPRVAQADMSEALRGCISDSGELRKVRTSGTSDTTVMITCEGESAQILWEAVRFYSTESGVTESDYHTKHVSRFFGVLHTSSQCVRTFQDATGRATDNFVCYIALDLSGSIVKAM